VVLNGVKFISNFVNSDQLIQKFKGGTPIDSDSVISNIFLFPLKK
jgi:hypothetical protein